MQYIRSLIFSVTFFMTTMGMSILIVPGIIMPFRIVLLCKKLWLRVVLWQIRNFIGIDYEERGKENIPEGPVIFAAKHQSAWDTLAPCHIHPTMVFVFKQGLAWIPIWGWYLLRIGMIPVNRGRAITAIKRVAKMAKKIVADDRSVLIFPQGTRTRPGTEHPYLPGVAAIYASAGVPVVPIALNSGLFWPRHKFVKWPGTTVLEYLPPIEPGLDRKTFMKTLADRIEPATARLEAEALRNYPYLPPIEAPDAPGGAHGKSKT